MLASHRRSTEALVTSAGSRDTGSGVAAGAGGGNGAGPRLARVPVGWTRRQHYGLGRAGCRGGVAEVALAAGEGVLEHVTGAGGEAEPGGGRPGVDLGPGAGRPVAEQP